MYTHAFIRSPYSKMIVFGTKVNHNLISLDQPSVKPQSPHHQLSTCTQLLTIFIASVGIFVEDNSTNIILYRQPFSKRFMQYTFSIISD